MITKVLLPTRNRKRLLLLKSISIFLLILNSMALVGCGGFAIRQLSPLDSDEQLAYLRLACDKKFAVREYKYPVYSEDFLNIANRTKCADSFFREDAVDNYDYLIEIEEPIYGKSSIPLLFILSCGIIPIHDHERYGCILRVTGKDGRSFVLDESGECEIVMGWIAIVYNISGDWAMHNIKSDERYYKRLAVDLYGSL